jgi:hypothetical protein
MYQIYHTWIHHSIILLHSPTPPDSWSSFNRYHFCINLHVYTFYCTVVTLLLLFPNTSPLPLVPALSPGQGLKQSAGGSFDSTLWQLILLHYSWYLDNCFMFRYIKWGGWENFGIYVLNCSVKWYALLIQNVFMTQEYMLKDFCHLKASGPVFRRTLCCFINNINSVA